MPNDTATIADANQADLLNLTEPAQPAVGEVIVEALLSITKAISVKTNAERLALMRSTVDALDKLGDKPGEFDIVELSTFLSAIRHLHALPMDVRPTAVADLATAAAEMDAEDAANTAAIEPIAKRVTS